MLGVIIKGNPKYLNESSDAYYREIEDYLRKSGVDKVEYDAGEDFTRPRQDADIYIGHSRGAGRFEFMRDQLKSRFLKFGVPDGIIHPKDLKWQEEVWYPGIDQNPPKEHFVFTNEQKSAIDSLLSTIKRNR